MRYEIVLGSRSPTPAERGLLEPGQLIPAPADRSDVTFSPSLAKSRGGAPSRERLAPKHQRPPHRGRETGAAAWLSRTSALAQLTRRSEVLEAQVVEGEPDAARMAAIIQKRTMILVSDQPLSSKW